MTVATAGKIVQSAAWTAVETWIRHGFTLAVLVVFARQLGAEAFGLAALAMIAPTVLSVPVIYGIPDALVQRLQLDPVHLDSAFWLLASIGLLLTTLFWLSAELIASTLGEPRLEPLMHWTSLIVLLQALSSVPAAVLKRQLEFRLFALRTTVGTSVGGLVGIAMALSGYGVWSMIVMTLVKASIETAILHALGSWHPRLRFSLSRCQDLFDFAWPMTVQSLWYFVNDELPKALLGIFFGPHAVGIYAFARRPLEFLTQCFLGPISSVAMPALSRLQQDSRRRGYFFTTSVQVSGLIGFPVFVGFAAVAPEVVPAVFGEHWSEAVLAVQIMMAIGVIRTLDTLSGVALLALGHSRILLKMNVLYTVLAAAALPVAAQIGVEAVLLGVVLCNATLLPAFLLLVQRFGGIDVRPSLQLLPRLLVASAAMYLLVTFVRYTAPAGTPDLVLLLTEIIIGGIAFATGAFLFMRDEVTNALSALRHMRN